MANATRNQVVVYRQNNGFWERGQELQAPDKSKFLSSHLMTERESLAFELELLLMVWFGRAADGKCRRAVRQLKFVTSAEGVTENP